MKKLAYSMAVLLMANPALAEGATPFFSLRNNTFVTLIAFLVFIGILLWAKAPAKIGQALDDRARAIATDLAEARALRDEAKAVLASFEARQKEVEAQSARIVADAKAEAEAAAAQAKLDLKASIARRIAAAGEQIKAAEDAAVAQVRAQAITVAVAAASDVLAKSSSAETVAASIDKAIAEVGAKLH